MASAIRKSFPSTSLAATIALASLLGACSKGDHGSENALSQRFSVGGSVSGLSGTVVLQPNAGDDLGMSAAAAFSFPIPPAAGTAYNVTGLTRPAGEMCAAGNASGTVVAANASPPTACSATRFPFGDPSRG